VVGLVIPGVEENLVVKARRRGHGQAAAARTICVLMRRVVEVKNSRLAKQQDYEPAQTEHRLPHSQRDEQAIDQ
jgi:hypothetical protein